MVWVCVGFGTLGGMGLREGKCVYAGDVESVSVGVLRRAAVALQQVRIMLRGADGGVTAGSSCIVTGSYHVVRGGWGCYGG